MKRKLLFVFTVILTANAVTGQVGLNTATPKTTLDVNAKRDTSGSITDNTQLIGLQAPRLTRAELTNNTATYGTDQKGALVYITDISSGTAIGQRINITATGYYYFDGTIWVNVANGNAAAATFPKTVLVASGNKSATGRAVYPLDLSNILMIDANKVTVSSDGYITFAVAGTYKIDFNFTYEWSSAGGSPSGAASIQLWDKSVTNNMLYTYGPPLVSNYFSSPSPLVTPYMGSYCRH